MNPTRGKSGPTRYARVTLRAVASCLKKDSGNICHWFDTTRVGSYRVTGGM